MIYSILCSILTYQSGLDIALPSKGGLQGWVSDAQLTGQRVIGQTWYAWTVKLDSPICLLLPNPHPLAVLCVCVQRAQILQVSCTHVPAQDAEKDVLASVVGAPCQSFAEVNMTMFRSLPSFNYEY